MGDLFLGLDLSTQVVFYKIMHWNVLWNFSKIRYVRNIRNDSRKPNQQLKSVLIDSNYQLVHSESVLFDDLGFNTTDGFINEDRVRQTVRRDSKSIFYTSLRPCDTDRVLGARPS